MSISTFFDACIILGIIGMLRPGAALWQQTAVERFYWCSATRTLMVTVRHAMATWLVHARIRR